MPRQQPDALHRSLEAGQRGGIFFLFGDDSHSKEESAARIVGAHLDPATRDFNYDQLRGSDVEPEALASALYTPPMMADWRVVVVREAQVLAANARTRTILEQALDRPLEGVVLVLVTEIPAGSKAQIYERLKRDAIAVEYSALSADDAPGWVMERATDRGLTMDAAAARALVAAVGADLGRLSREMDKLRDYIDGRQRITASDVEAAVGHVPRQNRWEWLDLVGDGKLDEARAALPTLLDAGESGVGLVLALGGQFLRLSIAAAGGQRALEENLPRQQVWLARRLVQQARRWTPEALQHALDDLLRADRLLKSTSLGQQDILEELLLRLQMRRQKLRSA